MAWPGSTFLGRLAPAELEELLEAGTRRLHPPGAVLLREGEHPDAVVVLLTGTVKLTKAAASGREALIDLRSAGDILGELGMVDGAPRSASAITLDEVEALVVPGDRFGALLRGGGGIAMAVLATVVERLRRSADRQLELGTIDVVGRVCARLAELAVTHGVDADDGIVIERSVSQQDLADWAGVSRDGVVRALTELRAKGWVDTGRRRVVVRRLEDVRQRAASSLT